jgi:hypothetical protein
MFTAEQMRQRRIDNPKSHILYRLRRNAKVRGIDCSITIDDIPEIPSFCPVLGIPLEYKVGNVGDRVSRSPNAVSVDRIDNSKGYVPGNIRIISTRANILKSDSNFEEIAALYEDALRIRSEKFLEVVSNV